MLPIECVVRGYLVGSGWKDYRATGSVCGHALPRGPARGRQAARAALHAVDQGDRGARREHRPRRRRRARRRGALRAHRAALDRALPHRRRLRARARHHHRRHEVRVRRGRARAGIVVGDEVLTPDSSRFWPVDEYAPGGSPPSYDKQYVRNWLETLDWDKTPPGPEIPAEVVAGTRARYVEAYERHHRRAVPGLPRRDPEPRREGDGDGAPAGRHPRPAGRGAAALAAGPRATPRRTSAPARCSTSSSTRPTRARRCAMAGRIAEQVLSNPLIEEFEVHAHEPVHT